MNRRQFIAGSAAASCAAAVAPALNNGVTFGIDFGASEITAVCAMRQAKRDYRFVWIQIDGVDECVKAFEKIGREFAAAEIKIIRRAK